MRLISNPISWAEDKTGLNLSNPVGWVRDQWNNWAGEALLNYHTGGLFGPVSTLWDIYNLEFAFPTPDQANRSPSYAYGYPQTVPAAGRPRQLVLGRPRLVGFSLYTNRDLDSTDYFLGWGQGPLTYLPQPQVDQVDADAAAGLRWAQRIGSGDQAPDARSARLRHLEPAGAAVNLEVWDLDTDGASPAAGSATATTTITVENDDALVRVHLLAAATTDGAQLAKTITYKVWHRASGAPSWSGGQLYRVNIAAKLYGQSKVYDPIRGGSVFTVSPALHDTDDSASPIEQTPATTPGYQTALITGDALAFAAGDYELQVEFVSQSNATSAGNLTLHAVEVEEGNAAYYLRWLAYGVVTVPEQSTGRVPLFSCAPAGLACKLWDGAAWRTEWTNNPIWLAAELAQRGDGLALGDAGVDWDRLKDEAAACDASVATLEPTAVPGVGRRAFGGYPENAPDLSFGDTVYLWRSGADTGTTATVALHSGALLCLHSFSASYTAAEGDQWRASSTGRLASGLFTVLSECGTAYQLSGLADDSRDYGGYLLENQAGEALPILAFDSANAYAVVARAFATAPTACSIERQRFRCDLAVDAESDAGEVIDQVLRCCRGAWWITHGEQFAAVAGRIRSRAATLDTDVQVDGTLRLTASNPQARPDHLVARHLDQADGFSRRSIPLGAPAGRVDTVLELPGVVDRDQAASLAHYEYNRHRLTWRGSVRVTTAAAELEPFDLVGVKTPRMGWGYDLTDPDAPVELADDHASVVEFLVVRVSDAGDDSRELELEEYRDALYTDSPGILADVVSEITFRDPFAPPAPVDDTTATYLGDLSDDGVFNPEVQVEWRHPHAFSLAGFNIYTSQDSGTTWQLTAYAGSQVATRFRVRNFTGALQVKVCGVNQLGQQCKPSDTSAASVTIAADTTAPATPAGLAGSWGTRATWTWDANSESDLDHYAISLDGGSTWPITTRATHYEYTPTGRSNPFQVKAVDRTGNASTPATANVTGPAPGTPSAAQISSEQEWQVFRLEVAAAYSRSAAHSGFSFRWSTDGSTWTTQELPQQTATFAAALADYSGTTLDVYVQAREHDVVGAGSWSSSKTLTLTRPDADQVDESSARKWAGESGADKTQTALDTGLQLGAGAPTLEALKSNNYQAPGDDNVTPGAGWAVGRDQAAFWGENGFALSIGGPLYSSDGDFMACTGMVLTTTGKGKRYPLISSTNFTIDGQQHLYLWVNVPTSGWQASYDYSIGDYFLEDGNLWAVVIDNGISGTAEPTWSNYDESDLVATGNLSVKRCGELDISHANTWVEVTEAGLATAGSDLAANKATNQARPSAIPAWFQSYSDQPALYARSAHGKGLWGISASDAADDAGVSGWATGTAAGVWGKSNSGIDVRSDRACMTEEGGLAILLTNDTGAASVKGEIVIAATGADNAFDLAAADEDMPIGVVYEDGIADGSDCWVVIAGRAQVLLKDSTAATRGNFVYVSNAAGRADATKTTPNTTVHWREIGHCLQTATAGTNQLAYITLHFN